MTTQNTISKPTLKFSQGTSVSNVNVSMIVVVCLSRPDIVYVLIKISLDSCK